MSRYVVIGMIIWTVLHLILAFSSAALNPYPQLIEIQQIRHLEGPDSYSHTQTQTQTDRKSTYRILWFCLIELFGLIGLRSILLNAWRNRHSTHYCTTFFSFWIGLSMYLLIICTDQQPSHIRYQFTEWTPYLGPNKTSICRDEYKPYKLRHHSGCYPVYVEVNNTQILLNMICCARYQYVSHGSPSSLGGFLNGLVFILGIMISGNWLWWKSLSRPTPTHDTENDHPENHPEDDIELLDQSLDHSQDKSLDQSQSTIEGRWDTEPPMHHDSE